MATLADQRFLTTAAASCAAYCLPARQQEQMAAMGIEDQRKTAMAMCALLSLVPATALALGASTSMTTLPAQLHAPPGRNCRACHVTRTPGSRGPARTLLRRFTMELS